MNGQDALDQARSILQDKDADAYRYSDIELVKILNTALLRIRTLRPDAFVLDTFGPTYQYSTTTLDDEWPIDMMFWGPTVEFIAGYAELRDDEFIGDGRAATLLSRFAAQILSNQL